MKNPSERILEIVNEQIKNDARRFGYTPRIREKFQHFETHAIAQYLDELVKEIRKKINGDIQ